MKRLILKLIPPEGIVVASLLLKIMKAYRRNQRLNVLQVAMSVLKKMRKTGELEIRTVQGRVRYFRRDP